MIVDLIGWAVLGLVVGFVASKFVDLRGDDPQLDLIMGVLGAVFAGVMGNLLSGVGVAGFTYWSFPAAVAGALVAVVGWHTVRRLTSRA